MGDARYVRYEPVDDGRIVRIILNRAEARNAQHRGLLVELDEAFMRAERDDTVRVVILSGDGPMFSSGHDLGSAEMREERAPGPNQHPTFQCNGATGGPIESRYRQEQHYYFENTRRWRNLRKITIAQVHGKVLSAALMLAWACDFIVADSDTIFADVVATRLGMCGVEYFAHPWELGPRKAKELLLTGDYLTADDAHDIGMVSKVFSPEELADKTLTFARRIAEVPTVASLLVKDSVNQSVDAMGFHTALDGAFSIHQIAHAHWIVESNGASVVGTPELGLPDWKNAPPMQRASKEKP